MIGGLMKSTSSLALTIAAGLVLSTNAFAADLGGNCCADLEERVAELEATTARKGNRKVSLTVSGQVNRAIMYWNDGGRSNTYFGLDNSNSSTRFGFSGNASINSEWKAGFSILLDIRDKGRSVLVSQTSEDGSSQERTGNANADNLIRLRDANWWLESSRLGRLTVGRLTLAGPTGTIDLGNTTVVAGGGEGCIGTSLNWRNSTTGVLTAANIGNASASCAHPTFRAEAIKYTSPTFAGFTFNASVGEAAKVERPLENYNTDESSGKGPIGMNYGADLRYAGEFNGLRIAATLGVEHSDRNNDDSGSVINGVYGSWGAALSLLHVPTGLFLQAEYMEARNQATLNGRNAGQTINPTTGAVTAVTFVQGDGSALGGEATANRWHLQGGVRRNWFGIGDTTLYAEYGVHRGWLGLNGFNNNVTAITDLGVAAGLAAGTSGDKMSIWGVGMVQSIDAAAMDMYLGYRNYSLSGTSVSVKDIDVLTAGARIKF